MRVRQAEAVARHWVIEEVSTIPGFHGAYVAGSANGLPDDAVVPATSDLDVNVVLSGPSTRNLRGKRFYRDRCRPTGWYQQPAPADYQDAETSLAAVPFRSPSPTRAPSNVVLGEAALRYGREKPQARRIEFCESSATSLPPCNMATAEQLLSWAAYATS